MYEIAKKTKELRGRKGYSQEELAERSGLSLRTIQRIENGETEPRGDSLVRLAAAFDVTVDDLADWGVAEDNRFISAMNSSALSFLLFPLLGIFVPLIIWMTRKDKVRGLDDAAKGLLNFQITWIIVLFAGWIVMVVLLASDMEGAGDVSPGMMSAAIVRQSIFVGVMYVCNMIMVLANTVRINSGKRAVYRPALRFIGR